MFSVCTYNLRSWSHCNNKIIRADVKKKNKKKNLWICGEILAHPVFLFLSVFLLFVKRISQDVTTRLHEPPQSFVAQHTALQRAKISVRLSNADTEQNYALNTPIYTFSPRTQPQRGYSSSQFRNSYSKKCVFYVGASEKTFTETFRLSCYVLSSFRSLTKKWGQHSNRPNKLLVY